MSPIIWSGRLEPGGKHERGLGAVRLFHSLTRGYPHPLSELLEQDGNFLLQRWDGLGGKDENGPAVFVLEIR